MMDRIIRVLARLRHILQKAGVCLRMTNKRRTSNGPATVDEYKKKRMLWLDWLRREDPNSIMQQIYSMIWDAAVYRVINGAREYAAEDTEEGGVQLNGMVHRLIDKCFFQSQAISIRRLLDKGPRVRPGKVEHAADGKRGVYSLLGLLEDVVRHAHLFTRENMLAAEEIPYDLEPVKKALGEYEYAQERSGKRAYHIPPELSVWQFEQRHEQIDKLTGVAAADRKPRDMMNVAYLQCLITRLRICPGLLQHVDKFVAHSATQKSRSMVKADEYSGTLAELWNAHEAIYKVTCVVLVYILGDSCGPPLPIPQLEQFAYIDRPLITGDKIDVLKEVWDRYNEETGKWDEEG